MAWGMYVLVALALAAVPAYEAYAQSDPEGPRVVINEVDTNPPSDDEGFAAEWVELYNAGGSEADVKGWQIVSSTGLKKSLEIRGATSIGPGQFRTFIHEKSWFTDASESVELRDASGALVDKTPFVTDTLNDHRSWQRTYDGEGSGPEDWKFELATSGASNGKQEAEQGQAGIKVTVSSEPSYWFGQTAVISGSVSERVFRERPYFTTEALTMEISGPGYSEARTLYPDKALGYEASVVLHRVLGIEAGTYDVAVEYAGVSNATSFSVSEEEAAAEIEAESRLVLATDKPRYIPGEYASVSGRVDGVVDFEGVSFEIIGPAGEHVSGGTLFPVDGAFATDFFVSTVGSAYGPYEVRGAYSGVTNGTVFEVVREIRDDAAITLETDREAYAPGETVTVSGRVNDVRDASVDIEVAHAGNNPSSGVGASGTDFKIHDGVRVGGSGEFTYEFAIPNSASRHGDYSITASAEKGSATVWVAVVGDPASYAAPEGPITISTDLPSYEIGGDVRITGTVSGPDGLPPEVGAPVSIRIFDPDGLPLSIAAQETRKKAASPTVEVDYALTAIPDGSGNYALSLALARNIFGEGEYTIRAVHGGLAASAAITVTDSLPKSGYSVTLDKDVYGLGETVMLSGITRPTGHPAVEITLTRPDGTTATDGAPIRDQRFSWSWEIPSAEVARAAGESRGTLPTNYGNYKIGVSTATYSQSVTFEVAMHPGNGTASREPVSVGTAKPFYRAGETLEVVGSVIRDDQGRESRITPSRVSINVYEGEQPRRQIFGSNVYPDQGGGFTSSFDLPATIFTGGAYSVRATYNSNSAVATFGVGSAYDPGTDAELALLITTDSAEYMPGDTVTISGKPTKPVYLEQFLVDVIKEGPGRSACGAIYCGTAEGPTETVRPDAFGTFEHRYEIPRDAAAAGNYEVSVDAGFDAASIRFEVAGIPPPAQRATVIDSEEGITEGTVAIVARQKEGPEPLAPRAVSGALHSADGKAGLVNLRVISESGGCVIGPASECAVRDSTRGIGWVYEPIEVDGTVLNIRYTGPDAAVERFSIIPEFADAFLPDASWKVEVDRGEEESLFSYKVTYKPLG